MNGAHFDPHFGAFQGPYVDPFLTSSSSPSFNGFNGFSGSFFLEEGDGGHPEGTADVLRVDGGVSLNKRVLIFSVANSE